MKIEDFTEREQTQIKNGLSTAEITDKEAKTRFWHYYQKDG